MTNDPQSETVPARIGPYRIVRQLGAGGMGYVFQAVHEKINRVVALKVLRPDLSRNETLLKRFLNEARAAAMPVHDNLVLFYEFGQDGPYHYMALEYIDGRDVSWLIKKKGRLPIDFCLHVVKQVARALEHAHKNGFVHRDIKPSNIMITRAKIAKLTDLGLARQLEEMEDQKITRDGYTLGTVDYMSPEQSRNSHAADIRSDIYSLGCAWFHMLTGEAPYGEGTTVERLRRHAYDPIPNVRDKAPEVPEDMSFVIEKMMEKDPKSRYQNPTELLEALDQLDPNRRSMDSESIALLAAIERGEEVDVSKDRSKSATKDAGRRGARKTPAESDEIPIAQISHGPQRRPTAPSVRPVSSMTTVAYFAIGCIIGLVVLAIVLRGGSSGAVTPTTSLPTPADAATEAPAPTPDQETVTVPLRKSVP